MIELKPGTWAVPAAITGMRIVADDAMRNYGVIVFCGSDAVPIPTNSADEARRIAAGIADAIPEQS